MIPNSEFRVIQDIGGHLALFGIGPEYASQVDKQLGELLATPV